MGANFNQHGTLAMASNQVVHTPTTCARELLAAKPIVKMEELRHVVEQRLGGQGTRNMSSALSAMVQKGEVARATVDNELCLYRPGAPLPPGSLDHGFQMFRVHVPQGQVKPYRSTSGPVRTASGKPPPPAPAPAARILFTLEYGESCSLTVTKDEARTLYLQLHDIFGG